MTTEERFAELERRVLALEDTNAALRRVFAPKMTTEERLAELERNVLALQVTNAALRRVFAPLPSPPPGFVIPL